MLLLLLVGCCSGCNTVEVSGGVARMGTYARVSGVTRFGRPVYQHANKREYLYFSEEGNWG